jgi:hypothetical protein
MRKSLSRIVAGSGLCGNVDAVRQLAEEACKVGSCAVALLGTLRRRETDAREYVKLFKAVSEMGLPTFYIPGAEDAPFSEFLREAAALARGCVSQRARYSRHFRHVIGTFLLVWNGRSGRG